MLRLRALGAAVLAFSLVSIPLLGATTPNVAPLGTIIAADRGHVGSAVADVGTTVYAGDKLSADNPGSVPLRAGAARFLLQSAAVAEVNTTDGAPSANLLLGTATFSTGNAHAFTLFASTATIRAQTDVPTIGQITFLNPKELVVTARRGGLTVTVADETQIVKEDESFRVLLDSSDAHEPAGAGSGNQGPRQGGGPLKAGRSGFLILATALPRQALA